MNTEINMLFYYLTIAFTVAVNIVAVSKLVRMEGFGKKEAWIVRVHILGIALAILDIICIGSRNSTDSFRLRVINGLFFYVYSVIGYTLANYMIVLYGANQFKRKRFKLLFIVPSLLWLLVIINSYKIDFFEIGAKGIHITGALFWVVYTFLGNGYYLATIVQCSYHNLAHRLRKKENKTPTVYVLPLLIGNTIQILYPSFPGTNLGLAFTFFMICINNQEFLLKSERKLSEGYELDALAANAELKWHVDIQKILTQNAVYTYEFDVTTGYIPEDIVDGTGHNYTLEMGVTSPCKFDEIICKSLVDDVTSSDPNITSLEELNCTKLLELYSRGINTLELQLRYTSTGAYHRIIYLMSKDEHTGHVKALGMAQDVTVLKHKERLELAEKERQRKELEAALEASDKAGKAKTTFLFNMSHDIRTPMNAIMGYSDLLSSNLDDKEKCKDYIEKIKTSSEFLLSIINNILEMARIDCGKVVLNEQPDDVRNLTQIIENVMGENFKQKNIEFKSRLNATHYYAYVDVTKIREVFLNLISNAFKYTPTGGHVLFEVNEIECNKPGKLKYKAIVEDDGIGISEEFLPTIFEEFSRERTSTESKIQGTGLGMSIVKKLVDLMGGDIWIESELGKGTKITVVMEFKEAQAPKEESSENEEKATTNRHEGKRILLAEDNEMNAEIAIVRLEAIGFEIEHAENGLKCVEMLEAADSDYYDFILMDVQMPIMNGYKATGEIRRLEDETKKNIPIIAVTANAFEEDRKNALDAGMNGHIAKPMKMETLIELLDEIFRDKN